MDGVGRALEHLRAEQDKDDGKREHIDRILTLGETLLREIAIHQADFLDSQFEHGHRQSAAMFSSARKYCGLHAAASCLHSWIWNRTSDKSFFSEGKWVAPALERIFDTYLNIHEKESTETNRSEILNELQDLHRSNRMFSISAPQLATE